MEENIILTQVLDERKRGWFWDYNEVLDSDLSEHAKIVRLCLARFADQDGRKAWPSLSKIAEKASVSVTTVKRALNELEEKGWIQRQTRQLPNEVYMSTVYVLCDPPAQQKENGASEPENSGPDKKGVGSHRANPPKLEGVGSHRANPPKLEGVGSHRTRGWFPQNQGLVPTEPLTIPIEQDQIEQEELSLSFPNGKERDAVLEKKARAQEDGSFSQQPPQPSTPKITNRDVIAELTGKLHELPVEKLKGHYSLIGKAYNRYGYQAVAAAIEDLGIEFLAAEKMGMPLILSEKELARRLFARCRWNSIPEEKEAQKEEKEKPEWMKNWKNVNGQWVYAPEELDPNLWEIDRENRVIRRKKVVAGNAGS